MIERKEVFSIGGHDIQARRGSSYRAGIEVWLVQEQGEWIRYAEPAAVYEKRRDDMGTRILEPCFRLSEDAAQKLMDELWSCGVRPSEGSGSAGALAAVERHRDDLRAITFKLLEVHEA